MTDKQKDGGVAFPIPFETMTLEQWMSSLPPHAKVEKISDDGMWYCKQTNQFYFHPDTEATI